MNEGLGWWGGARWVGEMKIARKVSYSVSECVCRWMSRLCVDGWVDAVTD